MANITHNHIHETMDAPTLAAMLAALNQIIAQLPDGTLTPQQRKQYGSMDVRNLAFAQDALRIQKGNGGNLLPANLNNNNLETDLSLFKQIGVLLSRSRGLVSMLADIARIVGHEAYGTALAHNKFYQIAAKMGLPDAAAAADALAWRFEKQAPNKGKMMGPI